ncbi:MAG: transglycosylase SLT domain-containing protein [Flavobacteriales bacterium]
MKRKLFFMLFFLLGIVPSINAGNTDTTEERTDTDSIHLVRSDHPLIDAMDSMATSIYYQRDSFRTDSSYLERMDMQGAELPSYPDSVYKSRVDSLDRRTPLEMKHNDVVQAFIELYANERRDLTSRMLGMKEIYFPMIEQKLDEHGIPLELKYLTAVESALDPTARSPSGATGLWQFMYRTGKLYGLEVGSYVDERRDPVRSTEAACEYLKFLHSIYGDWNLVLAAYNAGPGVVNRAMRRSGGKKDYWELRPYLPRETGGYVPAFIAVNYVAEYYKKHAIVPVEPGFRYFELDTVQVSKPVTFEQISGALNISMDTLKMLNPIYRRNEVPVTKGHNTLRLPRREAAVFIANEDSIHQMKASPIDEDGYVTEEITRIHRVRKGEYLGYIANKYDVRISQLRAWNGLRGSRIHPGDRLTIHKKVRRKVEKGEEKEETSEENEEKADDGEGNEEKDGKSSSASASRKDEVDTEHRYHTVERGDTLWDIARKYQGVTLKKLRSLNEDKDIERLSPGQQILIEEGPS